MARYETTITTDWDQETSFEYLARFSNISEWDPNVERARDLDAEPLAVGARFELELRFLGRPLELTYETLALEHPRRVVLCSETATIASLDTIHCNPLPGGRTAVTYEAHLSLKGPLQLARPGLSLVFRRLGDAARDGLAERLSAPSPAALHERATGPVR